MAYPTQRTGRRLGAFVWLIGNWRRSVFLLTLGVIALGVLLVAFGVLLRPGAGGGFLMGLGAIIAIFALLRLPGAWRIARGRALSAAGRSRAPSDSRRPRAHGRIVSQPRARISPPSERPANRQS